MAPLVRFKGIPLEIGGKVYVFAPISFGYLEQLQERLVEFKGGIDPASVATALDVAFASLTRNYPEMTREDVAELIDLENFMEIFTAAMDVSGLRRKALEEAAKPGETTAP